MAREEIVEEAATYGLTGFVLLSVGVSLAAALVFVVGPAPVPLALAIAALTGGAYYGMKQFAYGIYEIVDRA